MKLEHLKYTMPGGKEAKSWLERKEDALPEQLDGKTVLDVGCFNGYYSILAATRGATVLSIDEFNDAADYSMYDVHKEALGLDCRRMFLNVYDLDEVAQKFDLVLFYDVFYHLENPMLALRKLFPKVKDTLLLSTCIIDKDSPSMYFFEPGEMAGEMERHPHANFWSPTISCVEKMLNVVGFKGVEMLNCADNRAIFRARTGKSMLL